MAGSGLRRRGAGVTITGEMFGPTDMVNDAQGTIEKPAVPALDPR